MITPDYHIYVPGTVEYFNGHEWHPIRDYRKSDLILQYTRDGHAQLVMPSRYTVNKKCRSYTIASSNSMIVCGNWAGRMPYKSSKNIVVSLNMSSIIEKVENGIFKGKFIGAFYYENNEMPIDSEQIDLITMLNETEIESWDGTTVRTSISRPNQIVEVIAICQQKNMHYEIVSCNEKRINLIIYDCPNIDTWEKHKYSFSQEQAQRIAVSMLKWNYNKNYTTTSIENADYYQFIVTSIGKRAIMKKIKGKYIIRTTNTACAVFPKDLNIDERYQRLSIISLPDRREYCLEVPSGMPIFRYRYNIYVAGGPLLT